MEMGITLEESIEPSVSIVIPVYNGRDVIQECLDSVLKLDYKNFETIAVDDCSSDGSAEFIGENYPNIKLIFTKRNSGFAAAVNLGIKHAKGDIAVLLNMDTVVDKAWLRPLAEALIQDASTGLVGSKVLSADRQTLQHAGGLLWENGISVHIGRSEYENGQYNSIREVDYLCGASLGFRKNIFYDMGMFDEGYRPLYYEDIDLAYRIKKRGLKVLYIPESVLVHKENISTQGLSQSFYYYYHKNRLRFIFKNFSFSRIFLEFLPREKRWFLSELPKNIKCTILRVYFVSIFLIIGLILKRMIQHFLIKTGGRNE